MRGRADGIGELLPGRRPWWGYLWAAPNSLVGLVAAASVGARPTRWRGVLLFEEARWGLAWFLGRRGFAAITLGHVIITNRRLSDHLLAHELGHVAQHERWGPLFYPAYVATSLTGYRRNPFERAAEAWAARALGVPSRRSGGWRGGPALPPAAAEGQQEQGDGQRVGGHRQPDQ